MPHVYLHPQPRKLAAKDGHCARNSAGEVLIIRVDAALQYEPDYREIVPALDAYWRWRCIQFAVHK
jgi:hypothetical protein